MTVKKSSLFENIKNSINSNSDNYNHQFTEKEIFNNIDNKNDGIIENKKIIKTISVDEKTQMMLNELKNLNYKINLSQLVRREVAKIYEELIKEIK